LKSQTVVEHHQRNSKEVDTERKDHNEVPDYHQLTVWHEDFELFVKDAPDVVVCFGDPSRLVAD